MNDKTSSRGVFRFKWDFGRHGTVKGTFVAEKSDVDAATGRDAYFGEVLGKHSEIEGKIEVGHIVLLTDDPEFTKKFVEFACSSGFNPLHYLQCVGCNAREEDCECGVRPEILQLLGKENP